MQKEGKGFLQENSFLVNVMEKSFIYFLLPNQKSFRSLFGRRSFLFPFKHLLASQTK